MQNHRKLMALFLLLLVVSLPKIDSAFHHHDNVPLPPSFARLARRQTEINRKLMISPLNYPKHASFEIQRQTRTELRALMDSIVGISPEPIHTAFSVATFFPQPFWLLIILLPNAKVTKQIMGGIGEILMFWNSPWFVR
jgi:hypothetical protein